MKKRITLFTIALLTTFFVSNAQNDWGLKGGLSFNTNGELKEFLNETSDIVNKQDGSSKTGYNIGLYGKLDLGSIYLRPELLYTKTKSEYSINSGSEDYELTKIDVPVLVGVKLIGPLNVFAGPAFQYVVENDLKGVNISDVEKDFTVGVNIGASIELGRFGFDARYERGFSKNEAEWTDVSESFTLDSRPEQLIFSLSYSFLDNRK
ncbi:porin family protein [Lutibacter sp. TH_r2]|uniref:porin family protein n=1 Tax=Lutibacter sp. TH_r2 TaxID=3082083 RepID=UPI0029556CF0|nr:porin family protein [Lutibacter sp. TH_r2]MDV7187595.1 porin family protein [Lutibacter sp. TH_r2]